MTQKKLKKHISYDEHTGEFVWIKSVGTGPGIAGKSAGYIEGNGYRHIQLFGKQYKAHRLAFLYMTGSFPKDKVDHINRVKLDNRWENLRACTQAENMKNKSIGIANTSGVMGVSWNKAQSKWTAFISNEGKRIFLGYFHEFHEAVNARKNAEVLYGYRVTKV